LNLLMNPYEYISNKNIKIGCVECPGCVWTGSLHDAKRRIVKHYHCLSCGAGTDKGDSKFDPLCFQCYCLVNPDEDLPRKFQFKEQVFIKDFSKWFKKMNLSNITQYHTYNKSIDGGCSMRRPDVFIDCGTHYIVLELDEHQHTGYSCETLRISQLWEDVAELPLVVLRLNPDFYIDSHEIRNPSCFDYSINGRMTIKSEWNIRMKVFYTEVLKYIRYYIDNPNNTPLKFITVKHLFYNGSIQNIQRRIPVARRTEPKPTPISIPVPPAVSHVHVPQSNNSSDNSDSNIIIIKDWNQKSKNSYRVLKDSLGEFLEVKLHGDYTFRCELRHETLVNQYTWAIKKRKNNQTPVVRRRLENGREIMFHQDAYNNELGYKCYSFKDEVGTNLRRYNIGKGNRNGRN
jgi:hypothetical protein